MTLDGFLEGANRELDWHLVDEDFLGYAREMLRSVDTILFGRVTYEMMAAYWPTAPREEIQEKMNGLPKIVFSRTVPLPAWANTTVIHSDAAPEVARLKKQPGRDMVVLGSGALASALLQAGLVDEYRVILNPIILGSGRPMFRGFDSRLPLKLAGVRPFRSGVVMLSYQPQ